jgi:hypothetical protein
MQMREQKERAFFQILTFSVVSNTNKQVANQCPERYNKLDKKVLSMGNFN